MNNELKHVVLLKSFSSNMASKYPDSDWKTMRGRKVLISDGRIVPETQIPGKEGLGNGTKASNKVKEETSNKASTKQGVEPRGANQSKGSHDKKTASPAGKNRAGNQSDTGRAVLKLTNGREIDLAEISTYKVEGDTTTYKIERPDIFQNAILEAKQSNDKSAYVDAYSVEDYREKFKDLFIVNNGVAGIGVKHDGDIASVFKHSTEASKQGVKRVMTSLLKTAIAHGGTKLDCFDHPENHFLPIQYCAHGFIPVARMKFNKEYAPEGWNFEADGEPDVYIFRHNGDDAETSASSTYKLFSEYTDEEVPYFDDYDEAMKYRDFLLEGGGQIKKSISDTMQSKYPGGSWVTMRGSHVYVTKGGGIAKETDPRSSKGSVREGSTRLYDRTVKDLKTGNIYSYGNSTVQVTSKGKKYVHITDVQGNKKQVLQSKFLKVAEEATASETKKFKKNGKDVAPDATESKGGKPNVKGAEEMLPQKEGQERQAQGQGMGQEGKVSPAKEAKTADVKAEGNPTSGTRPDVVSDMAGAKSGDLPKGADGAEDEAVGTPTTTGAPKVSFANVEVVQGDGMTDTFEDIYNAWGKEGGTLHLEQNFLRACWGIETSPEEHANKKAMVIKDSKGNPGAVALFSADPDNGNVYINYVETAPKHRKENNKAGREKGLGVKAIATAIQESIDQGYGGKVRLESLSRKETQNYYKSLGFKNIHGLYYELDEKSAVALLASVGKRYGISKSLKDRPVRDFDWEAIETAEDGMDGLIVGDIGSYVKSKYDKKYAPE